MEAEATFTVQQVAATAFMLYLCTYPIELVASPSCVCSLLTLHSAPFAIDMASRIF